MSVTHRTVGLDAKTSYKRDRRGALCLTCTRQYIAGRAVLRVRVIALVAQNSTGVFTERPVLMATEVDAQDKELHAHTLDALVDMVRLKYPNERFVVRTKLVGQHAV